MCLAIPGKIIEIVDEGSRIAKVEVGGVKRNINIGMLGKDEARVGDYGADSCGVRNEQG